MRMSAVPAALILFLALPAHAGEGAAQPWLAGAAQTRQAVLAALVPQAKQPPYDKALPLLQHAQAELVSPDPKAHAAAVDDAYDAALMVMTQTDNHALAARLFDGFLLPALPFASPDPARYDGRLHLLKTAVSVYGQAKMPQRQVAVLTLLRREAAGNENLQDWVSLQCSAVYAQRGQYAPAVAALEAVKTPVMMGPVAAYEQLAQKADAQKANAEKQAAKPVKTHPAKPARVKSRKKRPSSG